MEVFLGGVMLTVIYALMALGLTLVFGIMRIINFPHGEKYMLGSFVVYYLFAKWNISYIVSVIVAIVAVAIVGVIVERALYRPLKGNLIPTFIVALGLVLVLQSLGLIWFGGSDRDIPSYFHGIHRIFGAVITTERAAIMLIGIALIVVLVLFMQRTKLGRAMRCVTQDRTAASLVGINMERMNSMSMAIGCGLAAAAGALLSPMLYVNPYMGSTPVIKALAVVILGGMGSLPGAALGALVLGFAEALSSRFFASSVVAVIVFVLVIVVFIFRPTGLMGISAELQE